MPGLLGIDKKLSDQQIVDVVHQGKGRMPPFSDIAPEQLNTLIRYLKVPPASGGALLTSQKAVAAAELRDSEDNPAGASQYKANRGWFTDPDGYPAIVPPWGTLSAIDMNTGKYLWKIPLGYYPELAAKGMANTGTLNYGGPIVTAGGLVFIAATAFDRKFRAFDSQTGKLLWESELPLPGLATPATYMVNGKQYVLIATGGEGGGGQFRGATGGIYVAYCLP
jgi:quinoprotein glucose dehydrogenase